MECGFYHSDTGYWQTLIEPSQHELDMYPSGTISVPVKPSSDHVWQNNGWVYVPSPEPTPEALRVLMPDKTPREFRDILIDEGILTDAIPDEVTVAIQAIPYDKERTKALNAWHNPTMFSRSDPYIDMIGAFFNLTPDDIDILWNAE